MSRSRIRRPAFFPASASDRRRGSALILVVAILAVLGLLSVMVTFSSNVELLATRNWTNAIQTRMAAPGVPLFESTTPGTPRNVIPLGFDEEPASRLEPLTINLLPSDLDSILVGHPDHPTQGRMVMTALDTDNFLYANSLNQLRIEDTASKININALVPLPESAARFDASGNAIPDDEFFAPPLMTEAVLARFIDEILETRQIYTVDAQQLAHEIALRVFGPDGQPGHANLDDNANGRNSRPESDNLDNDGNGRIDDNYEAGLSPARDRLDTDRDGRLDNREESIETDGLDNDLDGRVDESNEGVDEPAEYLADPRLVPRGDDRPFIRLTELKTLPSMTPEVFEVLAPHLTTFSVSYAAWALPAQSGDGPEQGFPQLDPNSALPADIYEALKLRFPSAPPELLGQFVANLVDRRDLDDIPTQITLDGAKYLGVEITPYINEVCPDTASFDEDGDDGQFIELINPFTESISIDGWSLQGVAGQVHLTGSIPAGGFLVVTDDYDDSNDPTPDSSQGMGSFYDVFNRVATGSLNRLLEFPGLDIPNEAGEIRLVTNEGKVVDIFSYQDGKWNGATESFQRIDPRVRAAVRTEATPLQQNVSTAIDREALDLMVRWQNQPFASALDVMLVSTAFAESSQLASADDSRPWSMPVLESAASDNLDVRLVDCFRVGAVIPQSRSLSDEMTPGSDSDFTARRRGRSVREIQTPACDVVFGAINLNTASAGVLAALPGMDGELVARVVASRLSERRPQRLSPHDELYWINLIPGVSRRYATLSDFLRDEMVWQGRPLYDRLDTAYPFFRSLTTHSMALEIATVSRQPQLGDDQPRPNPLQTRRVVAADRGVLEGIDFRFVNRRSRADRDLRYARKVTENSPLVRLEDLKRQKEAPADPAAGRAQSLAVR